MAWWLQRALMGWGKPVFMVVNMLTLGKGLAGHFGFLKKVESGLFWAGDRT